MKRTFFQRILAALVACLMLAGTLGAVTASAEDWRDTMIAVSWTDMEGNSSGRADGHLLGAGSGGGAGRTDPAD